MAFSFSFPATAWALTGFGPWTSTGLRGALAGALAAICLASVRAPLPRLADLRGLAAVAAGCVVGFPLLTSLALTTSSTSHSAIVIGVLPLATAAFSSWITGRNQPRAFWVAALAGAALVVGFALSQNHGLPTLGDAYLAAAVLVCGAGYAEGGRLSAHMPGWQVIAWGLVAGLPCMVAVSAVALAAEPAHPTGKAVFGLAYVTLVSQFGGFVVWYWGMARAGVARASQLQLAQPLMTLGWSATLMGERVPPSMPAVAVLVLACVVATQHAGRPSAPATADPAGEACGMPLESVRG
nr:DMT family transporter [Segniliparus rugosus]